MVLYGKLYGRVGRCRHYLEQPASFGSRAVVLYGCSAMATCSFPYRYGLFSFSRSLTLAAVWESRSRLRGFAAAAGLPALFLEARSLKKRSGLFLCDRSAGSRRSASGHRDVEADANVRVCVWESVFDPTLERDERRQQGAEVICRLVGVQLFYRCA
jgi:hypothetical protein